MTGKGDRAGGGQAFPRRQPSRGARAVARLSGRLAFPYLLLLASGGHTQILAVKGVGDYDRLGTTMDDAIGEAFDKTAKMLGLPYPGGPAVEAAARGRRSRPIRACRGRCWDARTPISPCRD